MCLKHGPLHPIPNRPVMSKARASLPLVLYIDRFLGGVFSKRRIPKRTQFGPVEAPLVPQSELQEHYIHLKVSWFSFLPLPVFPFIKSILFLPTLNVLFCLLS